MSVNVDICGKRTLEYVVDCLSKFNRGFETVTIRAFGGNITKGVRVAQILGTELSSDITLDNSDIKLMEINKSKNPFLSVPIKRLIKKETENKKVEATPDTFYKDQIFINFPIYHVLFDALLNKHERLHVVGSSKTEIGNKKILDILKTSNGNFICEHEPIDNPTSHKIQDKHEKKEINITDSVSAALFRSGLLLSPEWANIASEISQYDDAIIGVDTNMLYNAALTEHIYTSLCLIDPIDYVHTPNWMLFVIPNAVMHEIEQASNSKTKGLLNFYGRKAFRALQELLELGQSLDLHGISTLICGDVKPELDVIVELKGLRRDLAKQYMSPKTSSGDTIIRDQFKGFLRNLNFFRGGIYFITSDKANASLALVEGINSIYYKFPALNKREKINKITPEHLSCSYQDNNISSFNHFIISIPIGKLIYELAVQFGTIEIYVKGEKSGIEVSCDAMGESLDHWLYRDLIIGEHDFNKMLKSYDETNIALIDIQKLWDEICEKLTKTKFI